MSQEKLVLVRGEMKNARARFDGGATFEVVFNPTEYEIAKSTEYAEATIPGLDAPVLQFRSGKSRTLSVELLLDTVTYGKSEDVRSEYIEDLEAFLLVDGAQHAPPPCKVVWGSLEFVGLLESLTKRYVLFKENGVPVRARVQLRFREFLPVAVQLERAPRSSPDKRRVHVLREGETLWQLAYEAYGDTSHWRVLAEHNGIDRPRDVQPGVQLVVPPLPVRRSLP